MVFSRSILDLHPAVLRGFLELKRRMELLNLDVCVTSTFRDFEAQDKLYKQGRSTKGNIVTNAKGGNSMHNYHFAFDICQNIKGKEYDNINFFKTAGQIWESMGGVWGGSFRKFKDMPHFEFTGGLGLADLQKGKKLDFKAKMGWE